MYFQRKLHIAPRIFPIKLQIAVMHSISFVKTYSIKSAIYFIIQPIQLNMGLATFLSNHSQHLSIFSNV